MSVTMLEEQMIVSYAKSLCIRQKDLREKKALQDALYIQETNALQSDLLALQPYEAILKRHQVPITFVSQNPVTLKEVTPIQKMEGESGQTSGSAQKNVSD